MLQVNERKRGENCERPRSKYRHLVNLFLITDVDKVIKKKVNSLSVLYIIYTN